MGPIALTRFPALIADFTDSRWAGRYTSSNKAQVPPVGCTAGVLIRVQGMEWWLLLSRNGAVEKTLALTPALSPRERENRRQSYNCSPFGV